MLCRTASSEAAVSAAHDVAEARESPQERQHTQVPLPVRQAGPPWSAGCHQSEGKSVEYFNENNIPGINSKILFTYSQNDNHYFLQSTPLGLCYTLLPLTVLNISGTRLSKCSSIF